MDKISVVVPAYNCQDTIERCIKSIQNQTYNNLEIIVVNDGSTDKTETLLCKMQDEDDRIKVISIPNGGVSHARNTGIDNATGDYITFVDSDDYIDEEMYETLHNLLKKYDVKLVHCSYKNVNGKSIISVGNTGKITLQDHDEAMKCLLSGRLFSGGNWNKLYDKLLFSNIRFNEDIWINEDVLANFELFDLVDKSVFIDKSYYSYVVNCESATHSMKTNEGSEQVVYVAERMSEMSNGKSYKAEADYRLAYRLLGLYRAYILSNNPEERDKRYKVKGKIKQIKKVFSIKDKINYYLLITTPYLYRIAFKIYDKKRVKQLDPT